MDVFQLGGGLELANWISGAIKHKGALTRKAKKAGMSPMSYAQKMKGASGKTGRQARLAITLRGLNKKNPSGPMGKMSGTCMKHSAEGKMGIC
jgi:hypothetical protein